MKIEIKYLVHFKAYFHSTFKNPIRFHPHKIQSTQYNIQAIYLKTIITDADILKHERKGAIFLTQFFQIFSKTVQKGRKAQKQLFEDILGTKNKKKKIKKNEKKIRKSRYKSRQFTRKIYLNEFFCTQVTAQPTTLPINELMNCYTCIFQEFCLYFQKSFRKYTKEETLESFSQKINQYRTQ